MSKIGILVSSEDVIDRLLNLDYELQELVELGELKEKLGFVILGGTALLMYNKVPRTTSDIDVIPLNISNLNKCRIKEILKGYNVYETTVIEFPFREEIFKRMRSFKEAGIEFENVDVYLASKEDIILSKIFSSRPEDQQDLIESDIMDHADMVYVREQFESYIESYLSDLKPNLDLIIRLRKDYMSNPV